MDKPTEIEISLGESFESFKGKYPSVKIDKQPIGAKFYEFYWDEKQPATIKFKIDDASFDFPNTISFLMMEAHYKIDEGISGFSFKSGITIDSKLDHDEARIKFYAILDGLKENGWKRVISLLDPRLLGSQSMHYMRNNESYYSTDISYLPSLDEWKALKKYPRGTYWELHADNKAFMTIKMSHKVDKTDNSLGVYLLEVDIKNDQEKGRSHFSPDKKNDWSDQAKWDAEKTKFKRLRENAELDLISKGYTIDESYQDFEINPK